MHNVSKETLFTSTIKYKYRIKIKNVVKTIIKNLVKIEN